MVWVGEVKAGDRNSVFHHPVLSHWKWDPGSAEDAEQHALQATLGGRVLIIALIQQSPKSSPAGASRGGKLRSK